MNIKNKTSQAVFRKNIVKRTNNLNISNFSEFFTLFGHIFDKFNYLEQFFVRGQELLFFKESKSYI